MPTKEEFFFFIFFFGLITCRVIDISLEHLLTLSHCAAQH